MPDGERLVKRKLVNPQMPYPKQLLPSMAYRTEMVKDAPTFKQIANEIKQFLEPCDIGGYNSNRFDIPMLIEEFLRCGCNLILTGVNW